MRNSRVPIHPSVDAITRIALQIVDERGMCLKRVADHAGVSERTVVRWRQGQGRPPTVCAIEKLANAMGYEMELLPVEKRA